MKNWYKNQINLKLTKPSLLLHVCCAPDLVVPLLDLKKYFKLYLFWHNPNIQPYSEYQRRYREYIKLLNLESWDYCLVTSNWEIVNKFDDEIYNQYDYEEFYNKLVECAYKLGYSNKSKNELLKEFSQMEEKSSLRCDLCYYMRLLTAGLMAKKLNIDYFTTTLLISPKKSVEKLDKYWKIVSNQLSVKYLTFNFRLNDGFKRASEYTRKNNIRRQNYCWCAWSIPQKLAVN